MALSTLPAWAQSGPFDGGWRLEPGASSLQFQSIKNGSTIETSSFATMSGEIAPDGAATMTVLLDSVDTKVDLRNVRMRFLFFETFQFPEAKVSTRIDPAMVADLATVRRKTVDLPFTLSMHGVTRDLTASVALTLIGGDLIAVSTAEPINLQVADFNLMEGLEKLQEAADVTIVPSSTVSFDLIFRRGEQSTPVQTVAAAAKPASAALEPQGNFDLEACTGRFEILSRTGNIYFKPGSARLDNASTPLLDSVYDIISRCPGLRIQIAGHTDSIGSASANQSLSERRAASVVEFLTGKGLDRNRMISVGLGEAQPVADNDTDAGRSRNRRIEFSVADS
ncbi:OmpA family protein [Pseudooceanicola sp.]